jgi:hypothetical protein
LPSLLVCAACNAENTSGYDGPFLAEADLAVLAPSVLLPEPDPALALEAGDAPTRPQAHPLNDSIGWAYLQVRENSTELNSWSLRPLQRLSPLIDEARDSDAWELDGAEAWGPFLDPRDKALEWVVWWDGTRLELRVRPEASDEAHRAFWSIRFDEVGSQLDASLTFDASLIADMPQLGSHIHDEWREYGGSFELRTRRETDGTHRVDVDWFDFLALDAGLGDSTFDPAGALSYQRDASGAGSFEFTIRRPFDDDIGFTGPEPDLARLEMHWDAAEHSFSRMEVDAPGPTNPAGDPLYGALVIHECSNDNSGLVWRDISDAYLEVQPEYEKGTLDACQGTRPWPAID